MARTIRTCAVLLALTLFAGAAAAQEIGTDAPNFTIDKGWNAAADAASLEDFRGKVVLVEIWATW